MKKLLTGITVALLASAVTASAYATDIKIGVIDLQQVMQTSPQVAALSQQIKTKFSSRQQAIETAQKKLRTTAEKLGPESKKLDESDRKKLEEQVASQQKQLQEMVVKFQEDVATAQREGVEKFMKTVNGTVSSIAKQQKLDVVLLKPALVYAADTIDVTPQVLKELPKS
ncbi:OmpH family outer membrane protein [soil metagenome]